MQRDFVIDVLRFSGLMLIILAHVQPPEFIFQLRTFDVPLMIFVSGMAYGLSNVNITNYKSYLIKRCCRLILPVWAFFLFFYIFLFCFKINVFNHLLTTKMIASTFLLNGFGYLWIIRVFIIIALVSPFLAKLLSTKSFLFDVIIILSVVSFTTITHIYFSKPDVNKYWIMLVEDVLLPGLSYSAIFMTGYKWRCYNKEQKIKITALFGFILTLMQLFYFKEMGYIIKPQDFKYPPTIIYLSYSIVMISASLVLVKILTNNVIIKPNKVISFISSNTIWIYLWHIPFVEYFKISNLSLNWCLKYLLVIIFATLITMAQVTVIDRILVKSPKKNSLLRIIFTG